MKKITTVLLTLLLGGCNSVENSLFQDFRKVEEGDITYEIDNKQAEMYTLKITNEFNVPQMNLINSLHSAEPSDESMSKEKAIEIGAYYVWEVLGWNLDDLYITFDFIDWPDGTRTMWAGTIGLSEEHLRQRPFTFLIDSITGERVDLNNFFFGRDPIFDLDAPEEDEILYYEKIALSYLLRHFNQTEVTEINPHPTRFFESPGDTLTFAAVDETGRTARIEVERITGALVTISTHENDVTGTLFIGVD